MRRGGQASLEMTVALVGALLLLFGSLKVFLWVNERLIVRQRRYNATRVDAGTADRKVMWTEPSKPLTIFE